MPTLKVRDRTRQVTLKADDQLAGEPDELFESLEQLIRSLNPSGKTVSTVVVIVAPDPWPRGANDGWGLPDRYEIAETPVGSLVVHLGVPEQPGLLIRDPSVVISILRDAFNSAFPERQYIVFMTSVEGIIDQLAAAMQLQGKSRDRLLHLVGDFVAAEGITSPLKKGGHLNDQPEDKVIVDDSTLARLRRRYDQLLRDTMLPPEGLKTKEEARAAGRLVSTYRNLRKREQLEGRETTPQDPRVTEAHRLREAFYWRNRTPQATSAPRRRRRGKALQPS